MTSLKMKKLATYKTLLKNPFIRLILCSGVLYLAWYFIYHSYINVHTSLDRIVIDNLIDLTAFSLESMGYTLMPAPSDVDVIRTVGIDGTFGLWIGDPCNGLSLFALFSIFIACYPGSWKNKIWFIPLGILLIHLINVLRIIALVIIVEIDYNYLDFNHDYTFTVVVYGFMFLLWMWWANSYSGMKKLKKTQ